MQPDYNDRTMLRVPPVQIPPRRTKPRRLLWWAVALLAGAPLYKGAYETVAGVPGPQDYDPAVLQQEVKPNELGVKGTVLLPSRRELIAVDLSGGKATSLYQTGGGWHIESAAGPNEGGKTVLLERNADDDRYRIQALPSSTLAENSGEAGWCIALAEKSDTAAYLIQKGHQSLESPKIWVATCDLVTLDLSSGKETKFAVEAYEGRIALDAEANDAYYVGGLERSSANLLPSSVGAASARKDPVPVVFQLDLTTGNSLPITKGWDVQMGPSNHELAIYDFDGNVKVFDLNTYQERPLFVPKNILSTVAVASESILVALAKPRSREEVQMTPVNLANRPVAMARLIIYDHDRQMTATCYRQIDPLVIATYSQWPR